MEYELGGERYHVLVCGRLWKNVQLNRTIREKKKYSDRKGKGWLICKIKSKSIITQKYKIHKVPSSY